MVQRPPRTTPTDTRFPYTTLFRSRVGALGAEHDPAGEILAGVADADFRRLAAAREHAAIDLGDIAGDGEALPAHGNAEIIGGGRDRRDGARRRSGDGARRLGRGRGPGAHGDLHRLALVARAGGRGEAEAS